MKQLFLSLMIATSSLYPLLPPPLKPGDTIALVCPAKPAEPEALKQCKQALIQTGYKVYLASNLMTRHGYFADTDENRAKAFMNAWKNPEVKALWCYAGGYGCTRILPHLDFDFIKDNPKILIGMSDVTALLLGITKKTGLITYLGPCAGLLFVDYENLYSENWAFKILSSPSHPHLYDYPDDHEQPITLSSGTCRGKLTGGNLALITSLIGTPWEIDTDNRILLLEDVNEEPYRIDRMLCQLKQANLLDKVAGVILCSWHKCIPKHPEKSLSLIQVLNHYFKDAPYPVLLHFPSGHIKTQTTLPIGSMAELDASKKTLSLL